MAMAPGKLQAAEYARSNWFIRADPEVSMEEVLDPKFYTHVASKMKCGDRIEVLADDLTWHVDLIVVNVEKVSIKVVPLAVNKLVKDEPSEFPDYTIRWAGESAKHRVIRKSDRAVLKSGFATASDAADWLREHLKKEAA